MFRPLLATRVNSSFSFSPLFVDTSRPPCFVNRDSCVFARVDHSRDAFGKTWTNRSRFPGGMEQRSEIGQIGLPVERIISWRIAIFQKRIFAFSVISPEFGNVGHRRRVSIDCTEVRIEIARRIFIIGRRECREGGCVNGKYELFAF